MAVGDGPAHHHEHTWDWDYEGMVWIKLTPTNGRVKQLYPVISWGKGMRFTACPARSDVGVVLFTQKDQDMSGEVRTLHLLSNHPVTVSFGIEDDVPAARCYYDINGRWDVPSAFNVKSQEMGKFWADPEELSYCYAREPKDMRGHRARRVVR